MGNIQSNKSDNTEENKTCDYSNYVEKSKYYKDIEDAKKVDMNKYIEKTKYDKDIEDAKNKAIEESSKYRIGGGYLEINTPLIEKMKEIFYKYISKDKIDNGSIMQMYYGYFFNNYLKDEKNKYKDHDNIDQAYKIYFGGTGYLTVAIDISKLENLDSVKQALIDIQKTIKTIKLEGTVLINNKNLICVFIDPNVYNNQGMLEYSLIDIMAMIRYYANDENHKDTINIKTGNFFNSLPNYIIDVSESTNKDKIVVKDPGYEFEIPAGAKFDGKIIGNLIKKHDNKNQKNLFEKIFAFNMQKESFENNKCNISIIIVIVIIIMIIIISFVFCNYCKNTCCSRNSFVNI